jgi:hypothetical protein
VPKLRGGGGSGVSANECNCAHEAKINFGDLALDLTYASKYLFKVSVVEQ